LRTYISILRGINVGGHRMIKMDALRQLYADLKFGNVKTYIQSGNVVFQSSDSDVENIEKIITKSINDKFGFEVPVIVLEFERLKQIASNNPFLSDLSKKPLYFHITFLSSCPDSENSKKLLETKFENEDYSIIDNVVYLYCPSGYSNSKLTNSFLENKLRVQATTRNWNTTNELILIAEKL